MWSALPKSIQSAGNGSQRKNWGSIHNKEGSEPGSKNNKSALYFTSQMSKINTDPLYCVISKNIFMFIIMQLSLIKLKAQLSHFWEETFQVFTQLPCLSPIQHLGNGKGLFGQVLRSWSFHLRPNYNDGEKIVQLKGGKTLLIEEGGEEKTWSVVHMLD